MVAVAVAVGLLWQPVLLDPKPAWYAFSVLKYANYPLFFLPFVLVYFACRDVGRAGWARGGLMLSIGYLLTLPYNAIAENAKMGTSAGFVMYHGGSWPFAIGEIVTVMAIFFGLGATAGHFGAKAGRPTRAVEAEEPEPVAVPGPMAR